MSHLKPLAMGILTRYVLLDLLKVFLLALTGLTLLVFVYLAGAEAVQRGIGLGPLVRMTPYLLPQAMQFTLPGTMLLATTSVFGRLAGYNEVLAVKSMGISPMALVKPTLVLATLVSLAAVLLNNVAVSWGRTGVHRVIIESLEEVAYRHLQSYHTYRAGSFNITVQAVEHRKLIQPIIIRQDPESGESQTFTAAYATFRAYPEDGLVEFDMFNAEATGAKGEHAVHPGEFKSTFPLDDFTGERGGSRSPSNYSLSEIPQAKREQRELIESIHREMTADTAFSLLTGRTDSLATDRWRDHEVDLASAEYRMHRFETEPYRRWSAGFSCLFFVMVGVPMAMRMRQSDFLAIFFVCFFPILLVYYPLLMISLKQAKGGALPPQAVWIDNIVLALWGTWLMRRVIRF